MELFERENSEPVPASIITAFRVKKDAAARRRGLERPIDARVAAEGNKITCLPEFASERVLNHMPKRDVAQAEPIAIFSE